MKTLVALAVMAQLGITVTLVYILIHFILKFW